MKQIRINKGLSMRSLAQKADLNLATVFRYEHGSNWTYGCADRIARVLKVPLVELLN